MKCTIPEISWHNREPILSVDIHPLSSEFYKLASGGGDSHVLIWQMTISDNGAVKQDVIADLTRHQKAVNVVRWSPSGQYLASADDDANIIIWQLKNDNVPLLEGDLGDREVWIVYKVLRGHKEDIYDLCWAVSSLKLFSGSVDNTAILWDLPKGKIEHILTDHKGFVQGVAWDPKNELIGTISTDRTCRLFDISGKHVKARINKGKIPLPNTHFLYNKEVKYFYDDTFKSFFRRLQFSPDGSILVVPSGHMESEDSKKALNSTLIFTLDNLIEPVAVLPLQRQSSTCVRFCPILFELREDGPDSLLKLPYRMIFAVGTDHDVILYDTQQSVPFARFHEIHYTRLTDLTWSNDGLLLIASSTDGFCALITFEPSELGIPYIKEVTSEENSLNISGIEELHKDENIDTNNKELEITVLEKNEKKKDEQLDTTSKEPKNKQPVKKKPTFLEQWAASTPKKPKLDKQITKTNIISEIIEIIDDEESEKSLENKKDEELKKSLEDNKKDEPKKSLEDNKKDNEIKKSLEDKKKVNILIPRKSSVSSVKQPEQIREIIETNVRANVEIMDNKASKEVPVEIKNKVNILIPRKCGVSNKRQQEEKSKTSSTS